MYVAAVLLRQPQVVVLLKRLQETVLLGGTLHNPVKILLEDSLDNPVTLHLEDPI